MSTISLKVGDTSWVDSITCDLCGSRVERVPTGKMSVATGFDGLIVMDYDYEEREFVPGALKEWSIFETPRFDALVQRRMDLCPICTDVVQDMLLERVTNPKSNAPFGTNEEKPYGTPRPRPFVNSSMSVTTYAELMAASAALGYTPPMPPSQPVPLLQSDIDQALNVDLSVGQARPPIRSMPGGVCIWPICGRPAMTNHWYCYEHAAREGQ